MKTLKMVLKVGEEKTTILSLLDPKDGLTKTEVETAMEEMVADQAILVGGNAVTGIKDCYIQSSERIELA